MFRRYLNSVLLYEIVQCSSAAAMQLTISSPYELVPVHVAGCGSILDVLQQRFSPVLLPPKTATTKQEYSCPLHFTFRQRDILDEVQSLIAHVETEVNSKRNHRPFTARSIENMQTMQLEVEHATIAGAKTCAFRQMWSPFLFGD